MLWVLHLTACFFTSALCTSCVDVSPHSDLDSESLYEPVGSEPKTRGRIFKCTLFWRTSVMTKWVICLLDNGYDRVWDTSPSVTKVILNPKSALDHQDFVANTICLSMSDGIWDLMSTSPMDCLKYSSQDGKPSGRMQLLYLTLRGLEILGRKLPCLVGTVISMKLAWGHITQTILGTYIIY